MPEVRDFLSTEKLRAYVARNSTPVAAGIGIGTPAAIILVWILETFVLKAPMPGQVVIAIGSVVATLTAKLMPGGKGNASSKTR